MTRNALRYGTRAVLVEVADPVAWHHELVRRRDAGEFAATDLVPGAGTVLVDGLADPDGFIERFRDWHTPAPVTPAAARLVEIHVRYDGPDLGLVARHWACTEVEVAERIAGIEFRVAFCGFAPGFAYLAGLPDRYAVPRLPTPRPRVPAGSVGLAGRYAGVYPNASPGGWLLVGRTEVRLFDVDADPPALLAPGTRVRFQT